jgi:hypothetical protein
VSAWVLTFDTSPLFRQQAASCYVSGVVPPPTPLPSNTTLRQEAILFEGASNVVLFEAYLNPQTLKVADAPTWYWPEAVSGGQHTGSTFTFTSSQSVRTLGPTSLSRTALETRLTSSTFTFVRNGAQASGTLSFSSQYACVDNGSTTTAQCPRTAPFAPDAASCSVTLPFTAQQQAQVPLWPRPGPPLVGVPQYGGFLTADFVTDPSCYVGGQLPAFRLQTVNQPRYLPVQPVTLPSGPALDVGSMVTRLLDLRLGDSPRVQLTDPLLATTANTFARSVTLSGPGPFQYNRTATESRAWSITLPFAPVGGFAQTMMTVRSEYRCVDSGSALSQRCPTGTATDPVAPDAASCQRMLPMESFQLP